MSVINVLTKEIYNKIAAGEVVEKPASVVKELVENSIDAKATNITIEILDGGIKYIKVADNGCGIEYDDFDKVFLAHATSKVKTIDDLGSIGTLGFRGEALSSIASVSKITLSSKTENSIEGYQVKISGGEMGEIVPIGATTGTYMIVEDLFFNIPARKKFLRKPKLEENDITNYVARLILANPNISFKYIADNKIVYQSFGTGLYDAIYAIYGKSIVDNIFEINFQRGDYKFSGFLGKPTFSKPNRTYQTLIINGRYVINQTISTAIYRAYENFLMKGNFPFFVINLNIPLDKVDVNVHPNKLEVKFEDSNSIFGMVYSEILDILYHQSVTKKITSNDSLSSEIDQSKLMNVTNEEGSEYNNSTNFVENEEIKEVSLTSSVEYELNKANVEIEKYNDSNQDGFKFVPFVSEKNAFNFKIKQDKTSEINEDIFISNNSNVNIQNEYKQQSQQESFIDNNLKIIGTIFNTYILVENNDKLLIIDQHAGHERLLYDSFINELNNKDVAIQSLLVPYVLETNYSEAVFINENLELINQLGFEIEFFGENSFKISTVPVLFDDINLEVFFSEILSSLDNKLIISKDQTVKEYIAKKACKSAVKGNTMLKDDEISSLLSNIDNSDTILLCPHGRPIVIEVTKKEIEKWFKRIV